MDKQATTYALIIIISFFVGLAVGYDIGTDQERETIRETITQTDTMVVHDTIRLTEYKKVERTIVDTMRVWVPGDTVFVSLPKEQLLIKDDEFTAQISGFQPHLDFIEVYPTTYTITTEKVAYKRRKWGLGVQAGYGVSKEGFSPYIGIGVQYNLLQW